MCWDRCATEGCQPRFTTQSFPHLQPWPAEHQHQHHLPAWHQLQNVVPELCSAAGAQWHSPGCHGQPPPSFPCPRPLLPQQGQPARTKMFKSSCHMEDCQSHLQSGPSAVYCPQQVRGWRCRACLYLLLLLSLRAWNVKCAHMGTQASHSMEKATPGADRGLKVSGFEKHRSKSRCFHSHRQELIVGSALAYRLSFLWLCPQSLWLFSVVSDHAHKELFH